MRNSKRGNVGGNANRSCSANQMFVVRNRSGMCVNVCMWEGCPTANQQIRTEPRTDLGL